MNFSCYYSEKLAYYTLLNFTIKENRLNSDIFLY